jgi:phage terminase large subunit GpA-like protein
MSHLEQSIKRILNSIEFNTEVPLPSEWIEKNRYVQKHVSKNLHGQFKFSNTPYMREIVDHLSPYSPVSHITIMKGVRTGGTFSLVHNGVCYLMKENPNNIMLLSANETLAKKTMKGVDFGIDGCNIRYLLGKGSNIQTNSKGDTIESKHFSGGYELFNFGGQSITNMRQVTASVIIADEVDAMKGVDKKGGAFLRLMEDRARDAGESKILIYISSPLMLETSLIYSLYLKGDQRKYKVPCPCCGEYIEFVWNERNENNTRYGVIFDIKKNEVVKNSVRYRCGICENDFEEKKYKMEILNAGYWKPTVERQDNTRLSYHISALYAPTSMDGWYDYAKQWQNEVWPRGGIKFDSEYQSFENSILGWPHKPEGIVLKANKLQENRRDYKIGECPFELSKKDGNGEIMLITLACDLNGYEDDGRLDYEFVGYSEKGPSYSIDAGSIGTFIPVIEKKALEKEGKNVGKIDSERVHWTYKHGVENSIWTDFEAICQLKFGDIERVVDIVLIDLGHLTDLAKAVIPKIKRHGLQCIGVMGDKIENFQPQSKTNIGKIYDLSTNGETYLLNVNIVKDGIAKNINANQYVDDDGQLQQDERFMNYPHRDEKSNKYTYRNYFAHFEAEHKLEKKSENGETKFIWEKRKPTIQNHFLDVRVYNDFGKIFMQDLICSNFNPFKVQVYGKDTIKSKWSNACKLIKEACAYNNSPLS